MSVASWLRSLFVRDRRLCHCDERGYDREKQVWFELDPEDVCELCGHNNWFHEDGDCYAPHGCGPCDVDRSSN